MKTPKIVGVEFSSKTHLSVGNLVLEKLHLGAEIVLELCGFGELVLVKIFSSFTSFYFN